MISLAHATALAAELAARLAPACDRVLVAGSIRRRQPQVKDLELVARPRGLSCDLFGKVLVDERHELDARLGALFDEGVLEPRLVNGSERRGRRYQALRLVRDEVPVDLFVCLPPAEWGALLAIRTGPADFSKRLVTECQRRGLRCVEGRLVRLDGTTVETPTEEEFFAACGVPWVEPEMRR